MLTRYRVISINDASSLRRWADLVRVDDKAVTYVDWIYKDIQVAAVTSDDFLKICNCFSCFYEADEYYGQTFDYDKAVRVFAMHDCPIVFTFFPMGMVHVGRAPS